MRSARETKWCSRGELRPAAEAPEAGDRREDRAAERSLPQHLARGKTERGPGELDQVIRIRTQEVDTDAL